jgi:hypothetical protein
MLLSMDEREWEEVAGPWVYRVIQGGWMIADSERAERFAVRFAPDEQGRVEPVELRLDSRTPIDSTMLRRLPLTIMQTLANTLIEHREQLAAGRGPSNVPIDGVADDPLDRIAYPFAGPMISGRAAQSTRRRAARLKVPDGAKGDGFYQQVAMVYSTLAAASNRPAVELAEANQVPLTTAHRWVKEARRRGFLPPGQKGRRG